MACKISQDNYSRRIIKSLSCAKKVPTFNPSARKTSYITQYKLFFTSVIVARAEGTFVKKVSPS